MQHKSGGVVLASHKVMRNPFQQNMAEHGALGTHGEEAGVKV